MTTSALETRQWLNMLLGSEPAGAFVELRYPRRDRSGWGSQFYGVRQAEQIARGAEALRDTDVYIGVLPRSERRGSSDAVAHGHVFYVDCDTPESIAALEAFSPAPSAIVSSGSGRHAYWALDQAIAATHIERGSKRLAHALGADSKCTDAARILRVPGTLNHKTSPPRPVEMLRLAAGVYSPADVVGNLAEPPARKKSQTLRAVAPRPDGDESPGAQDAAISLIGRYSAATELWSSGEGRMHGHCPFDFHEDRNPSFGLFPDGGYVCSCGSGDIVRLFVHLRGEDFVDHELPRYKRELRGELGLVPA